MAGGNSATRFAEGLYRLAERPDHATRWLRGRMAKGGSPLASGLPWISWKAIDYLDRVDFRNKVVYEYGGGGSTIFFAKRGARVITNETHPDWTGMIADEVKRQGLQDRVEIVTFTIADEAAKKQYLDHILTVGPWDIALIDGADTDYNGRVPFPLTRMECVPNVRATAKQGCVVIVDDAWRPEYRASVESFSAAKRFSFRGLGPFRPGVTQTDVYQF